MSEILKHAAEAAYTLDTITANNFGAKVQAPTAEIIIPKDNLITRKHPAVKGGEVVPLGANFSELTKLHGRVFGLLLARGGKTILYPSIITTRTTPSMLHVTYLEDEINPTNIKELTPLQKVMLTGGLDMQDPSVGTEHSHGNATSTAVELGHTAMAMRALTDSGTLDAIRDRSHIVHDWGHSAAGIAPNLSTRTPNKAGAFDMQTAAGARQITFKSLELQPTSPYLLVSSSAFEQPDTEERQSKLVIGIGLLAAQQHHGNQTNEQLTKIMSSV